MLFSQVIRTQSINQTCGIVMTEGDNVVDVFLFLVVQRPNQSIKRLKSVIT